MDSQVALLFTTVLDELTLGLVDEDEESQIKGQAVRIDAWQWSIDEQSHGQFRPTSRANLTVLPQETLNTHTPCAWRTYDGSHGLVPLTRAGATAAHSVSAVSWGLAASA